MKSKYQTILFDLDGTLTDSYEGITKSVQYALRSLNMQAPELDKLGGFVGPSLREELTREFGLEGNLLEKAVVIYREYFNSKGIYENHVYNGVEELLKKLNTSGATLAVASTKPQVAVDAVLQNFHLTDYFSVVLGSLLDGSRTDKQELIDETLRQLEVKDKKSVLMVGDRKYDAAGAKAAQVDFCGVLYGYGGQKELAAYPYVYLAESVEDLEKFLISK